MTARSDYQFVVRLLNSVGSDHAPRITEDTLSVDTGMQPDAVFLVPLEWINQDGVRVGCTFEHSGQHDAVVVAEGLVAENRDVEHLVAAARENFLDSARSGHAISDDNQSQFGCH